jgi:hypothetical protein
MISNQKADAHNPNKNTSGTNKTRKANKDNHTNQLNPNHIKSNNYPAKKSFKYLPLTTSKYRRPSISVLLTLFTLNFPQRHLLSLYCFKFVLIK